MLPALLVVAVALAVRVLYLLQARDAPLFGHLVGDGRAYWAWADRLLAGDWLGERVFYQAPLYPYLLALLRLVVGDAALDLRAAHALLGSVACGLVVLAGRDLFSRRVGLVAGLGLAFYAPSIFLETQVQKGAPTLLLTALLLVAVGRFQRSPSAGRQAAVGLVLGLLALTREEALLLLPVWALWSWRFGEGRARRAALAGALLAGAALPLGSVVLRNLAVGGELVLTTAQAGPNFYIGNNPGATGTYVPLRAGRGDPRYERTDAEVLAEAATGRELSPGEVSRFWFGRALEFVREQPLAWLSLLGRKALLLVNAHEVGDAESQELYERYSPLLAALASVWHFGVLFPLAAGGAWLALRDRRRAGGLLLIGATLGVAVIAFYVFARYRYPLVPVCVLLAAGLVVEAAAVLRGRGDRRRMATAAVLALVVAVPSNRTLIPAEAELATSHANAAAALLQAGDEEGFHEHSARAIELGSHQARVNLGVALARAGRPEEAVRHFLAALPAAPDDPRLLKRLGTALGEAGRWEEAALYLRRSLELFPRDPETASNLAYARRMLER